MHEPATGGEFKGATDHARTEDRKGGKGWRGSNKMEL